jgi:hypothetical protein
LTRSTAQVLESKTTGERLNVKVVTEAQGPITLSAVYRGRSLSRSLEQTDRFTPVSIDGPWRFHFEGVEEPVVSRDVGSWTDKWPDFSGTGWYEKEIVVDREWLGAGRKIYLDLGEVKNIAAVRVNGTSAGVQLWPPYRFEVTELLTPGTNRLEIGVTNTLANRFGQGRPGLVEKPASGLLGPVRLIPAKVLQTEFTWR